ncbi:MAG: TonB-dependent receptor [Candidatus Marinimicrobia bacterium]|nr:TonB-dependent receptor [Candidatus Neomarinimicrobiota bacterium]
MKRKLLTISILMLMFALLLNAATTGKISGTVTDMQTGDPLMGANIIVNEAQMGAAADINGNFIIANIPPGLYTVQISMIGYATQVVREVRVEIDLTTKLNVDMKVQSIQGEVVEVVAQKKVIKKDVAGSQKSVSAEEIQNLPVSDVGDVLGMKAGINSALEIRGSSNTEILFAVDGISMRDSRTNAPEMVLPLSAMQEVSVQTGGLSAQYGNVRSGVVNVVSKEGDKDSYSGTFTIRYSPPEAKQFGDNPYHPDSFWLRPFMDEEVCWTGTENGAWDRYDRRQYESFEGWNAFSQNLMSDDDPTNDLTPAAAKRLFEWQYRRDGAIESPDQTVDLGFGGPVPFVSEMLGDLRFYLSHRNTQSMYPIQLTTEGKFDNSTMLKLTSDLPSNMKLVIQGIYNESRGTSASGAGASSFFSTTGGVASAFDRTGFTRPWRLFTNTYWCPTETYNSVVSAKLNKIIDSGSFFTLLAKRTSKKYHTTHGAYRDTTLNYDIFPGDGEYLVDEAPFGFWPIPVSSIEGGITMGGAVSTSRDFSEFTTWEVNFDYTNQLNFRHQLKAGLMFHYDGFKINFGSENLFLPGGNYWTKFDRDPFRFTGYVEDKIEYEGFITTLGLVPEIVVFNGKWYDVGPYDAGFFSGDYSDDDEKEYLTKDVKPQFYLSPRLAISHPITEMSKLFFNYGHYREMPDAESQYRIRRDYINKLNYIGDPTLPLTRTISYEIGFDQAILNTYLLHISAYYKSIDNETAWTDFYSIDGKVSYSKLTSNHYEDIRGFEIELEKNYGDWLTGMLNYEYRVGTSGYFGISEYYENPSDQNYYNRHNPYRQYWNPARHNFKAYLDFHTPMNFGPQIANQNIIGGWHFTLIGDLVTGRKITWNPRNIDGLQYNLPQVDYHNVDLKVAKTFQFDRFSVKFFADVYNLLNTKRFSYESFYDIHDFNDYMYSLHFRDKDYEKAGYSGIEGDDKYGTYRDEDVEFQPMEYALSVENVNDPSERAIYYDASLKDYYQYSDGTWTKVSQSKVDKILEDKAYIDMPNQTFFTFLSPRDVFVGMTISFDLK